MFSKGTRLKWTQTTVKYGVVVASVHAAGTTTVTIATTTDFVLTAAAISANYYSYAANPQGYPTSFVYTPTWSSDAGTPPAYGNATVTAAFSVIGTLVSVFIEITMGSTTTYGSGNNFWTWSLPISPALNPLLSAIVAFDSSAGFPARHALARVSGSTFIADTTADSPANALHTTSPFVWAQSDIFRAGIQYRI